MPRTRDGARSAAMNRHCTFALAALLLLSPARDIWIKAKCALCHGVDGASRTDYGKKVHAPDLRADATQKQTDEALTAKIAAGHQKMPAFQKQVSAAQVRLLVTYIREVRVPAPPSPRPQP